MAKKRNSFGGSLEEVDANISALNAERKAIADKINKGEKISGKENKRFSELDNTLTEANNARSSFVKETNTAPDQKVNVDSKTILGDPTKPSAPSINPGPSIDPNAPIISPVSNNINPQMWAGNEVQNLGVSDVLGAFGGLTNTPQIEQPATGQPAVASPTAVPQVNPITGQPDSPIANPDLSGVQTPLDSEQTILSEFLNDMQPNGNGTVEDAINQAAGVKGGSFKPTVGNLPQIATSQAELNIPGNNQILKGNVGGRIIGNQPIFVESGGVTPMAVLNNRRVAQQNAVLAREAERQKIFEAKAPELNDARFQRGFNEQFNTNQDKYITAAKEEYGDDWDKALKDQTTEVGRAYVNSLANFDFLARIGNQGTDKVNEVLAGMNSGDTVYSPQTRKLAQDYQDLEEQFAEGNLGGLINLQNVYGKLEGGIALDKLLKDQDIDIKGTVIQSAWESVNDDERWVTNTQKKTAYEDQIKVIAADLAKNQMAPSVDKGLITEEEISDHLNALYGYESISDRKITAKPKGGGGSTIIVNQESTQGEPIEEVVGGVNITAYDTQEVPTDIKPVDAVGLTYYNADGSTSKVDGSQNVDIVSLQLVKIADPNKPGEFKFKKVAIGTHEEEDVFGNKKEKTRAYDMEDMGSRFITDKVITKEDWDILNDRFDKKAKGTDVPEVTLPPR